MTQSPSTGFGAPATTSAEAQGISFGNLSTQASTAQPFANLSKTSSFSFGQTGLASNASDQSKTGFGQPAEQPKPIQPTKTSSFSFGQTTAVAPTDQTKSTQPSLFGSSAQNVTTKSSANPPQSSSQQQPEKPKALITVPPTFTPPTANPTSSTISKEIPEETKTVPVDSDENNKIFARMVKEELIGFEKELKEVSGGIKNRIKITVGSDEESTKMIKATDELMEMRKEALETVDSLRHDVQTLRLELSEMFTMQCEANSKCDFFKDEK